MTDTTRPSIGRSDDPGLKLRAEQFASLLAQDRVAWVADRRYMKKLGGGGQGSVLLAERRGAAGFRIPVAIKFFSPRPFRTVEEYDQEMQRLAEVSAMVARIQHDHLVAVHTFIEDGGIFFMEMEWIDGFDMLHILRRDTLEIVQDAVTERRWANITERVITTGEVDCRLKPGMAVAVIRACLEGTAALHRGGVIHCDLKPSNVMVKRTGQVKIIDIGSAYWVGRPPQGQPCTLEYAAPEVLVGYRASPQSDLASLGYMLLEMLTGSKPFAGLHYGELRAAKQSLPDRLPALLPTDAFAFSEHLITFMRRLIHPDPNRRFPSAEDAELSDEGAAGFLKQLVLSELSSEYASEMRQWITEMETDIVRRYAAENDDDDLAAGDGTTRIVPPLLPLTQAMDAQEGESPSAHEHDFDLDEDFQ
ncbi:MAG: serine/threonine protein kinase [Planctomycetaceae bacterium]|nr:serine/threonine protein kinase [Planctomycetaceae bacterium]